MKRCPEELLISIECLKGDLTDIECGITNPTNYGKWPSNEEFDYIAKKSEKRKLVIAQIQALEDVKNAIEITQEEYEAKSERKFEKKLQFRHGTPDKRGMSMSDESETTRGRMNAVYEWSKITEEKLTEKDVLIIDGLKQITQLEQELEMVNGVLEKIAYPIEYLQQVARSEGRKLNGLAAQNISNDATALKQWAREALTKGEKK